MLIRTAIVRMRYENAVMNTSISAIYIAFMWNELYHTILRKRRVSPDANMTLSQRDVTLPLGHSLL